MNIFLIGGASPFVNALIDKLNKNGHRVYLLTGKTTGGGNYNRVFERYDFVYESNSVYEVLSGVQPDVVLFLGAYDVNFNWKDARKESVHFTASLMSILSAYASLRKGRFLYLSSQEIFANSYLEDIPEDEPASAKDFRALAIVQGEEICRNYQEQQGVECVIARLDHLYGFPTADPLFSDPCARIILDHLRGETVCVDNSRRISMLFQNDAVEFLYQLLAKETLKDNVYNLSSGQPITERQIAEYLMESDKTLQIQDVSQGEKDYRQILSPERFQKEFQARLFVDYQQGIQKEWKYIRQHKKEFLTEEKARESHAGWRKEIFWRLTPYLESIVCIIPTYFLSGIAARSTIFDGIDFYLLYELIIATVHGQQTAVFAAFLAAGGYLLQQSMTMNGMLSGLLNYKTYLWIAQMLIVGMAVGYLKDQIQDIRTEEEHEVGDLKTQLAEIESINNSNARMKQMFEHQIINQKDSLGKIYEITSELEKKSPEEVLFYAAKVLAELMNTKDTAVYMVANADYARLFSFTSAKARQLGSSICYSKMKEMDEELKKQSVFVNHDLDENYPLMACGIYTNDKMQLILMLWGLPLEKMNLAETNRLRVVSYLIQNAMLRAREYLDALQNQRYLKGSNVLTEAAFTQLATSFLNARDQQLTECALLEVENVNADDYQAVKRLEGYFRQSDYIGVLHGRLYILLSNTNDVGSQAVVQRLKENGIETVHGNWEDITE